jgi:hypothetical protein
VLASAQATRDNGRVAHIIPGQPREPRVVADPRYRILAGAVTRRLNTLADEENEAGICVEAVNGIADYVASLPCACEAGYDGEPCGRCRALGRWHDTPMRR